MISGLSAASTGLQAASARFDAAARGVIAATEDGPDVAVAPGGLSDALVGMAVSRFAFLASVKAAQTSLELITESLQLGRS